MGIEVFLKLVMKMPSVLCGQQFLGLLVILLFVFQEVPTYCEMFYIYET